MGTRFSPYCPPGKALVSGGVYHTNNLSAVILGSPGFEIHASLPQLDGRWVATVRNASDSLMYFVVQAMCANAT